MNSTVEHWLPIPDYEGLYDVSDQGRIKSWHTWKGADGPRFLHPTPRGDGYATVCLYKAGRVIKLVHALILLAFVGPRPEGMETRHLDGNPSNNHLNNLVYGTPSENNFDYVRHGMHHEARKTHCLLGHQFDEVNTYRRPSGGQRQCRTCRHKRYLASRESNRIPTKGEN